jgi:formamidopyrimidine-DNA glycosylase
VPELPEVETVRDGLARWVVGRRIATIEVRHPRAIRRHEAGAADLSTRLAGATIDGACRRGKFLWLPLSGGGADGSALVVHLGMSGQLLVQHEAAADERHLHVRLRLENGSDGNLELRFVDQRTFGGVLLDELTSTEDNPRELIPQSVRHIARDPFDPAFDDDTFVVKLRRKQSAVKRCLLDQTLISGIGNIYADEALWRTKLNGERLGATLSRAKAVELLAQVRGVLTEAIHAGGTSFDALYVNVNGESGYFERALNAYGRAGQPCARCGTAIRRSSFMNRSSFYCPRCQVAPRALGG